MASADSNQRFTVRGYGRASDEKQVMSPKQQEDVCLEAFNLFRKVKPDWSQATWGGFFCEPAITRTSKMTQREVGGLVLAATKPGDVIMGAKYDRLFANVIDACEVIELIEQKRFRICILDMDVDLSTALGQCFFKVMAAIKEMEVKEIRQRASDSAAYRRKFGLPNNGKSRIGWRIIDRLDGQDGREYIEDEGQRNLARRLLLLRHKPEHRFSSLRLFCQAMNQRGLLHPSKRPWQPMAMRRWLTAATLGFPKGMHDADLSGEFAALASVGGDDPLT